MKKKIETETSVRIKIDDKEFNMTKQEAMELYRKGES